MGEALPIPRSGRDLRRLSRSGIFLAAVLRHRGNECTVIVRDISERGVMVEADCLPEIGAAVELVRADLRAVGSVAWRCDDRAGLEFADKIAVGRWAPGLTQKNQMDVDRKLAQAREAITAGTTRQNRPKSDDISDTQLDRRLGEELGILSRRVGRALQSISSFAPVIARHPRDLQELEVVEQLLVRFETVLAAEDRRSAVEAIGQSDIRRRLLR